MSVEGIFSNGSVLAKVGTSMLCLVARMYNVPIMICCETFKFADRVQIDAFVYNEHEIPWADKIWAQLTPRKYGLYGWSIRKSTNAT